MQSFEAQCHRDLTRKFEELELRVQVLEPEDGKPKPLKQAPTLKWRCDKVHHFSTKNAIRRLNGIDVGTYCKPFPCNFPTADSFILIKKADFYGPANDIGKAPNMVVAFKMTVSDSQEKDPKPSHIVRSQDEVDILKAVQHALGGGKSFLKGAETDSARQAAIAEGRKQVDLLALVFLGPQHCVAGTKYMQPLSKESAPRGKLPTEVDKRQYIMPLDQTWDEGMKDFANDVKRKRPRTDNSTASGGSDCQDG